MQQLALEVVQAWNIGPFPIVEGSLGGDEHVARVFIDRSIFDVLNLGHSRISKVSNPLAGRHRP